MKINYRVVWMIPRNYRKMYDEMNAKNEEFEKILASMKGSDDLSVKNIISIDNECVGRVQHGTR